MSEKNTSNEDKKEPTYPAPRVIKHSVDGDKKDAPKPPVNNAEYRGSDD